MDWLTLGILGIETIGLAVCGGALVLLVLLILMVCYTRKPHGFRYGRIDDDLTDTGAKFLDRNRHIFYDEQERQTRGEEIKRRGGDTR